MLTCKSQSCWMTSRKQCLPDTPEWRTYTLTETMTVRTGPSQVQTTQSPSTEEKWTQSPTSVCNWHLLKKGKWSALGLTTKFQVKAHGEEELTNTKIDPWFFFCGLFDLVWYFCFIGVLLVLIGFCGGCCVEREKEHKSRWVERWAGSRRSWERGNKMI